MLRAGRSPRFPNLIPSPAWGYRADETPAYAFAALDLTNPLPPSVGALARWISEPVKQVWLPAQSFIPNAKGYPVLSKACQAFLRGVSKVGLSFYSLRSADTGCSLVHHTSSPTLNRRNINPVDLTRTSSTSDTLPRPLVLPHLTPPLPLQTSQRAVLASLLRGMAITSKRHFSHSRMIWGVQRMRSLSGIRSSIDSTKR